MSFKIISVLFLNHTDNVYVITEIYSVRALLHSDLKLDQPSHRACFGINTNFKFKSFTERSYKKNPCMFLLLQASPYTAPHLHHPVLLEARSCNEILPWSISRQRNNALPGTINFFLKMAGSQPLGLNYWILFYCNQIPLDKKYSILHRTTLEGPQYTVSGLALKTLLKRALVIQSTENIGRNLHALICKRSSCDCGISWNCSCK